MTVTRRVATGQTTTQPQSHRGPPVLDAAFQVLSYPFRVRTSLPAVAELMDRTLGRFEAHVTGSIPTYAFEESRSDRSRFQLLLDGAQVIKSSRPARVLDYLIWHVLREAVGGSNYLLVHAGVVARDGEAVLLPAASGSGKTTLVAGLVRAGFDYLSDEIAAIDPTTGQVAPFPLSLSVKPGSMDLLADVLPELPKNTGRFLVGRVPVRADDIRPEAVGTSSRVGYVVSPRYEAGAATTLESCSRGQGLAALGRNAFNFPSFGRRGLYVLADVVREARCYRLRVGELDQAVDALTRLVRGRARA